VTIDDTYRTTAEVEADKIAGKPTGSTLSKPKPSRQQIAAGIDTRAHQLAQRVPFGQPILVGHHSENKMRRHYENSTPHSPRRRRSATGS